MKILFLTQICPYPPTNGGAIKTYNILKHLGTKHDVDFLTFIRSEDELPSLAHLAQYCRRVDYCVIKRSKWLNLADAAKSFFTCKSFIISRDSHPVMHAKVNDRLKDKPDLIYADHLQMFQFVPQPAPCLVLLDEHNVEWKIIERFASSDTPLMQRLFASLEWRKLRSYELDFCKKANIVLTVTAQDRDVLVSNGVPSEKVTPLPVGVDANHIKPVSLPKDSSKVLSLGTMSWPPNIDAVAYFVKSVYPFIKSKKPDARFTIAGANPPPDIGALAERDPSIEVTGYVDDIRTAVGDTGVFVVPLRIGGGMRVKILDAMALGLPIVTTSVGCEGISINPGEHVLVADTPEEFADSVVYLLRNYDERLRLGSAGRSLVENRYSWPSILSRLDRVLAS